MSPGDIAQDQLVTFVQEQIEFQITIDYSLITLASRIQTSLIDRAVKIVPLHSKIANYLASMNTQSYLALSHDSRNFLMFTQICKSLRLVIAVMDYPTSHALYTAKPYSIMVCNWITALPIANLNLTGEYGTQFRTWTPINGIYSSLICPEYCPSNVQNWSWQLVFRSNNIEYRVVSHTNITYEFNLNYIITESAMNIRISGSGSILDAISVSAFIIVNSTIMIIPTQMTRTNGEITVSEILPTSGNITFAELTIMVWNAPSPYWNASENQQAIECRASLILPVVSANQSSIPTPLPSGNSNNTTLTSSSGIVLDGSAVTLLYTVIGGCSVGATIFVRNAKTLRNVKKK